MKKIFLVLFTAALMLVCGCIFAGAQNMAGDVDSDGFVRAADARIVLRAAVGLEALDEDMIKVADVDNNGIINSADARLILRAAVGLEKLHIHTYNTEAVIKEATCVANGEKRCICVCSEYKEEVIPATGHKYRSAVIAPTCTQQGCTVYTCSACNYEFTGNYIAAKGHLYKSTVTQPTCTAKGYTTKICIYCSEETVCDYTDAKGHSYTAAVTQPTCTERGYTVYSCVYCEEAYKNDYVAAKEHSYSSTVISPTCTMNGYTTYSCTECGSELVGDYVAAKGHSYNIIVTAPTCTRSGYTTYSCTECDSEFTGNYVKAKGHSYNSTVIAPTCTDDGYTVYSCSACENKYTADYVNKKGHSYAELVTAPTCTDKGYTTYSCLICADSFASDYTPAKGHSYKITRISATCTQDGNIIYSCLCGYSYSENISAVGHSFDGEKCSVCDAVNPDYTAPVEYANIKGRISFEKAGTAVNDNGAKLLLIPMNSTAKNYSNMLAASFVPGDYESGIRVRVCDSSGIYNFSSSVPVGKYLLVAVSANSNSLLRYTDEYGWSCGIDVLLGDYFSEAEISCFKTLCSYYRIYTQEIELVADAENIIDVSFEASDF
ncbi:MAG: dockerin type I repeat-containing protein [Clostridia bacterium]|nr:dockerin type I repeat-containing protein [Clostridia bacterium]